MTLSDKELGMDRAISRRDFVNGVAVAVGGSLIAPGLLSAREGTPQASGTDENYPPALTGRGFACSGVGSRGQKDAQH